MTGLMDLYARAFAAAPEALLLVDHEGTIVACNDATRRVLGHEPDALVGSDVESLIPSDLRKRHRRQRAGYYAKSAPRAMGDRADLTALRSDGSEIAVDVGLGPLDGPEGYLCVMIRDATDRRRQQEHLARLANEDPLTGVLNRRGFHARFAERLDLAQRSAEPIAVLLIDLDNFKELNDTFGHQSGDAALVTVARVLRDRLRSTDLVGRLGGDEFVAALPDVTSDHAVAVADEIRVAIARKLFHCGVTASIGLARWPDEGGGQQEIIAAADDALYQAKEGGRDVVRHAAWNMSSTTPGTPQ